MSFVPEPPSDPETQKIIDKFAQYVAKNGPGFEEITRQKQYDNPKFAFLFGREHSDYYRFRLMVEIQNLATMPPDVVNVGVAEPSTSTESGGSEKAATMDELRKQIADSENNLKAQKQVLQLQKEAKTEALLGERETKQIFSLMRQVGLDVGTFETLIDHMITSGSKETISNSKKWIFDNCETDQLREVILTYLLYRVRMSTASDNLRLHILYLVNDWAHHCQRKKLDSVRQMLSRYVPKLYVYASTSNTLDRSHSEKLDKLVGVWEGYKYFDDSCYKQLRNNGAVIATEQAQMFAARQSAAEEVERELDETYRDYERQHVEFERHIRGRIAELEAAVEREKEAERRELELKRQQQQQEAGKRRSRFDQGFQMSLLSQLLCPPQNFPAQLLTNGGPIPSLFAANVPPPLMDGGTPLAFRTAGDNDLLPTCPYYELPAGMMVPLVAEEDCTFKALDPGQLRIPPPIPPSERLLAEKDRFYAMHTTPDRPRDMEGWEVNGLAEFFRRKSLHRQEVEARMKEDGKTFKDAITNRFVPPTPLEDRKAQESSTRSRRRSGSRNLSGSSSASSSSSSSRSSRSRSRSRSQSRSRSRSTSRSPKRRQRFHKRSLSPEETRAGFGVVGGSSSSTVTSTCLPQQPTGAGFKAPLNREQNKGAQLMAKMGWEGRGLGANEQGIEEPIHAGEVRDRQDQFRGVGSTTDMFDEYRKQMSARTNSNYRRYNMD